VLLDLDSRVFTPLNDPLNHVVFSSATEAVRATIVGGRWRLREGALTGIDEAAILGEARELGQSVLSRHDEAFAQAQRLLEPLRAGWLSALATDPGVSRSVPLDRR
jgi:5-methylthioadenosine/S-adenosylhomocysteine deaminase